PAAASPAPAPAAVSAAGPVGGARVISPMPGTILSVKCAIGDSVKAGQVLFILEAMKMENEIVAPADGSVKQILAAKGQSVETDQLLAVL
ncbi:MAG: biotin/lipoyl-binding protein, partial [Clostridia bacterium]|nr:biotin/lipoyl-binding protein [Clostridia bacterium]